MSDKKSPGDHKGARRRVSWSDAFSVGVPEIDADHRILFELIGQMRDAATAFEGDMVTGSVLAALADYVDYHFEREERVMEAVGYPEEAQHAERHARLRGNVEEFVRRYHREPSDGLANELAEFLEDWLNHHILDEDMRYRPYAENNHAASAAASSIGIEFFMDSEDDSGMGPEERPA